MMNPNSEGRSVSIHGLNIFYESAGHGFALILIHYNLLDLRMWDTQIAAFAEHFHTIRFDLPGMGKSSVPLQTYSELDTLIGLLDSLQLSNACLVGIGLGSVIAMEAALAIPERIDKLILASPFVFGYTVPPEEAVPDPAAQRIRAARKDGTPLEELAELWLAHPIYGAVKSNPSEFAKLKTMIQQNIESWHLISSLDLFEHPEVPIYQRIDAIQQPTLVLYGSDDDANSQSRAKAATEKIALAQLMPVEGATHLINMEQPDAFNQIVLDFLGEKRCSGAGG